MPCASNSCRQKLRAKKPLSSSRRSSSTTKAPLSLVSVKITDFHSAACGRGSRAKRRRCRKSGARILRPSSAEHGRSADNAAPRILREGARPSDRQHTRTVPTRISTSLFPPARSTRVREVGSSQSLTWMSSRSTFRLAWNNRRRTPQIGPLFERCLPILIKW